MQKMPVLKREASSCKSSYLGELNQINQKKKEKVTKSDQLPFSYLRMQNLIVHTEPTVTKNREIIQQGLYSYCWKNQALYTM